MIEKRSLQIVVTQSQAYTSIGLNTRLTLTPTLRHVAMCTGQNWYLLRCAPALCDTLMMRCSCPGHCRHAWTSCYRDMLAVQLKSYLLNNKPDLQCACMRPAPKGLLYTAI